MEQNEKKAKNVVPLYLTSLEGLYAFKHNDFSLIYAQDIVKTRIMADIRVPIWHEIYSTFSLKATGKTQAGNLVHVYAHVPNYFTVPENLAKAIGRGLVSGAGIMPEGAFYALLDQKDDERVFVVDDSKMKGARWGRMPLEDAVLHPATKPLFGVKTNEEAINYFKRYREAFNEDNVEILPCDSAMAVEDAGHPIGRFLGVSKFVYGSFMNSTGFLLGFRKNAEIAPKKDSNSTSK